MSDTTIVDFVEGDATTVAIAADGDATVVAYENEATSVTVDAGAGPPGASAYNIAVANGFVGTEAEWLDSLAGGGLVSSVNTQIGDVVLDAADVGADPVGTASGLVSTEATARGSADTALDGRLDVLEALDTIVEGDSRLSNARTPTAHATSHQDGGSDELALDGSQIVSGTVADARIASTIARDSEVTTAVADEASARDTAIALAIADLIASAPGVLDTLDEIAAALGDDPDFAATITTVLAGKQPLDANLSAIAALATTVFGRSLLVLANAAALRSAAELGTSAVQNEMATALGVGSSLTIDNTDPLNPTIEIKDDLYALISWLASAVNFGNITIYGPGSGASTGAYVNIQSDAGATLEPFRVLVGPTYNLIEQVNGDLEVGPNNDFSSTLGLRGLVVRSPNGHRWRLTIVNDGTPTWTDIGA